MQKYEQSDYVSNEVAKMFLFHYNSGNCSVFLQNNFPCKNPKVYFPILIIFHINAHHADLQLLQYIPGVSTRCFSSVKLLKLLDGKRMGNFVENQSLGAEIFELWWSKA